MHSRSKNPPGGVPALVTLHGASDHSPRHLERDVTVVGRARGCDLCLEASDVSTVHCVLFRAADGYHVRDCNSRTGTRVNGDAVKADRLLRDGDILQVGPFSFELKAPAATLRAFGDAKELERIRASRSRLAGHALRMRRLLRARSGELTQDAELAQEHARLQERIRVYDQRLLQADRAEHDLRTEREAERIRIREVEADLSARLEEVNEEIRAQWQAFEERCRAAQAERPAEVEPAGHTTPSPAASSQAVAVVGDLEARLARERETLQRERQEFDKMKQQLENGQAEAGALLEQQRAAHAKQEASLRAQRAELTRMMAELRQLQQDLRRPHEAELDALARENEQLRATTAELEARLAQNGSKGDNGELAVARAANEALRQAIEERDQQLAEIQEHLVNAPGTAGEGGAADQESILAENEALKQALAEKEKLVEELRAQALPKPIKSENELEQYEGELNEYRQQLETDRTKLQAEIEQLRVRNQELDEATRDMEMEMSRERAELGRERIRMERMREELRADMEKLQREMSMRESLGPVQRLRDEMAHKKPGGKPGDAAPDRMRHLRPATDTPRSS